MNKWIVIFNTGLVESPEKVGAHYLHLYDIHIVKHIISVTEGTQWNGSEWIVITKTNM